MTTKDDVEPEYENSTEKISQLEILLNKEKDRNEELLQQKSEENIRLKSEFEKRLEEEKEKFSQLREEKTNLEEESLNLKNKIDEMNILLNEQEEV